MDLWKYFIIILMFSLRSLCSNGRPFSEYQPSRDLNQNTVCGNTAGLSRRQWNLCVNQPHSVASAIQGLQVALYECKVQFRGNKWNCSALETRNRVPLSSPFIRNANGNKESAFAFAISSAGIVHQVAHACSIGKIKECECRQTGPEHLTAGQRRQFFDQLDQGVLGVKPTNNYFEHAGCNHNINFGLEFAVEFLDSREERDFVSRVHSHNHRVGRLIVANNMGKNCRCHGTSGSCSMKTCWNQTPDFKAVGLKIKDKYENARKVSSNAFGNQANIDASSWSNFQKNSNFKNEDLIFFDNPPNYCVPNRHLNVAGTRGRLCNHTAGPLEHNSCENLCCNRGYTVRTIRRVEQCRCRFHWCCYVNCEQCEWEETVSVCN